ncbi:MAG: AAA family ATPase [Nanoarchaeota archaeon]|nr:AAA family ATPase [Nanoarchaeota archaeon]
MNLKKIKLKNIRSYSEGEISFPEGSILLSGDIGSGKTSILLAIEYALFGLQPGQRGSSLLANGKNLGEVTLEFEINGKNIIIERRLRRGSKTVTQDYSAITINGQKIELSVTELKTKILQLLNYPSEFVKKTNLLYRFTVYTPQEEMKQIILEDPESRLNILRHIFGIDKYKRIKENLLILTAKLREESRILQVEVRDLEENRNKLDSIKKFVKLLFTKVEEKQKIFQIRIYERKAIEEEAKKIESKIKEKEKFEREIDKTKIMLMNKEEQLYKEEKDITELEKKISEFKEPFEESLFNKIIEEIKTKKIGIEELNKNYINVSGKINSLNIKKQEDLQKKERIFKIDICPTCLQDVSDTHKHNILNETESQITKIENQTKELDEKLQEIGSLLEKEKISLTELESKISQLEILKIKTEEIKLSKEKILSLKKLKEELDKDTEFLNKHMEFLKESVLEFSKFDNLFKIKQEELKQAFQNEKQAEIEIAELKKELELTKKEIKLLEEKILEIEKIKEKLIHILDIEKWLSNNFSNLISFTEKNIMIKLREEFSKLFNKWFGMLTTDAFYVHLDENFTPIITQGEFELDYAFLSGGERTAVALAYRLSLNQIINSLLSKIKTRHLVILDEPTDGFSEQQLDKVRDVLQELDVNQLILVSHEQKIEGFVDNVIRLKKERGVSIIENQNL